MIQFKGPDSTYSRGIMDIKNCRILKGKFRDSNGDYIYGLNIMGRKDNQDFYSYKEEDIDMWYQKLTPLCILLDLNSKYSRMNKIGKGNFATVYKYKRKSDDKCFAVKSLEKKKIIESKRKRDTNPLLSEIDIMRVCDHPQVIKLYEVYEADKHVHLVMEILEGGELFNRIRNKGTYTESDAIKVMKNLLEALAYLHDKGVVHRDLKPENLILANNEDDYNVKIADFGLATFVKPGEKLELPCGSPGYVAYELLQDPSPGYDTKADIFSVGVILYVLLTGRPAFHGTDYKQILAKNKQGEPPYPKRFWSKITESGQELVKSMIQKNQEIRLSAKEALAHPWFNESGSSQDLNEVLDNFKELEEEEKPSNNRSDVSNPLLTTTPVMAGRHLKDTCESPWNPSGLTPKMNPATPMLKNGFNVQPRRMENIPGVGPIGALAQPGANANKPAPAGPMNPRLPQFDKFEEIQKKRNQRQQQQTKNFGALDIKPKQTPGNPDEENKIDPETKTPVQPLTNGHAEIAKKLAGIDKASNNNEKESETPTLKQQIDSTPETKPLLTEKRINYPDTEVNIRDEELEECPKLPHDNSYREAIYKSFKPGVSSDARVIPPTPGENQTSM